VDDTLLESALPGLGVPRRGKVRDVYDLGRHLLIVATDRISAFDVILLNGIPGKGVVLTQLSCFWFLWLESFGISHHLITSDVDHFPPQCRPYRDVLRGRSMLVIKTAPLPIECIVRGYLSGSGWKAYRQTGTIAGARLPAGLRESDRLTHPLFTPSTKAEVGGHDVNISFEQMQAQVGVAQAEAARATSLLIYEKAAAWAEARGILIADTKMEFGLDAETGRLRLIDEVLTPDSSRFWPKDAWQPGGAPPSFDKQFVRDYLLSIHWNGMSSAPRLPEDVVRETGEKYREAMRRLTDLESGATPG